MYAIGIDLGTTNTSVSAIVQGKAVVFENDEGDCVTPSCVTFTKEKILIGEPARHLMVDEPENTILSVKRIIGKHFDNPKLKEYNPKLEEYTGKWQFKVEGSDSGRPKIKIDHLQETYYVEEISGLVLDYMRRIACKRLDEDVRDAVVTVPAYFNHMQRTATKTAAELAGLNVLRILNEPTAAAISFGMIEKYPGNCNILVFDFGGGTLDVAVLSINGSEIAVKALGGSTRLGGDDLTNSLVDYFDKYLKTNMGKDITHDKRAKNELWLECEKAKKELTHTFQYELFIENIGNGVQLKKKIVREKFVSLNKDFFDSTINCVETAIQDAGMERNDIHFVLPIGGSSKIPYVIEKLKNYFGEDAVKYDKYQSPEHAIARGAAIYAAYLKRRPMPGISEVNFSEITPFSIGFETMDGRVRIIIMKNEKIPVDGIKVPLIESLKTLNIQVCQGEKEFFKDNEYLGKFSLDAFRSLKTDEVIEAEVCFGVDGIMLCKAAGTGMMQRLDAYGDTPDMKLPVVSSTPSRTPTSTNQFHESGDTVLQLQNIFSAEKAIGPEGGSIELLGCRIDFPPNLFKTVTMVKITVRSVYDDTLDGYIVSSPELECSTSGEFENGLATITLPIHAIPESNEVTVVTKQDRDSDWEVMDANPTMENRRVSFLVSHFTIFKILIRLIPGLTTYLCHNIYFKRSTSALTFQLLAVTCVDDETVKRSCRISVEEKGFMNPLPMSNKQVSLCWDDKMRYRFECDRPDYCVVIPNREIALTKNKFRTSPWQQNQFVLRPPPKEDVVDIRYFLSTPDEEDKEVIIPLEWKHNISTASSAAHLSSSSAQETVVVQCVRPSLTSSPEAQAAPPMAERIGEREAADPVSNVEVLPSTKEFFDLYVKSSDVYLMDSKRIKGKVLIINNEFLGQENERDGSLVDVRNLENLWTQLGFQVTTKKNLRGEDMSRSSREFARDAVDINLLVLIIMSHGGKRDGQEIVCGEDNQKVSTEQIISYFTSKNAPHLQGIPKILMFQACRGVDLDQSVEELSLDADLSPDRYPERSDMLIVYPSQAGYAAFRSSETGTWLMNAVTTIFMRDAKDTHVLDMLTKVNDAVALKKSGPYVQMTNEHSCLRKKLFLFPGWL